MGVEKDDRFCSNCGSYLSKEISQKPEKNKAHLSGRTANPLFLLCLGWFVVAGGLSFIMLFNNNNFLAGDTLNIFDEEKPKSNLELESEAIPNGKKEAESETGLYRASDQLPVNTAFVNVEALELRSAADTEADIIDRLTFGDILEVLKNQNEWLYIITSYGKEGWVLGDYVVGEEEYTGRYHDIDLKSANYRGNTVSNIMHMGMLAIQGDWIYFINKHDERSIYKVHVDGSKLTKLNSDKSFDLNVTGNWIFYSNESEGYRIYRINLDGKERTEVNHDWSFGLNVVGNWIYYNNVDEYRKIYRIRTDGSERTKLNNDDSWGINVFEDWIYYTTLHQQDSIFKIRCNGNERYLVHNSATGIYGSIFVDNGWIYYSDVYNNEAPGNIYKVRIDGSELTKLSDDRGGNLNFVDGYIYYRNISDQMKIYRIRPDGSGREKVSDDSPWETYVVGEWLCYYYDNGALYRMRTDGSEKHLIY